MSKLAQIQYQKDNMATLEQIVQAYENLASLQIRQIRDRVLRARQYFHELWNMYDQLRIDIPLKMPKKVQAGSCAVLISTDTSFSGGLDEQIINQMLESLTSRSTDIIVVGRRGAQLLQARSIEVTKTFRLPPLQGNINVVPIMNLLSTYEKVTIYFARFESVTQQQVVAFELRDSVTRLQEHEKTTAQNQLIFASDFIFEPNVEEVVRYLEGMMSSTALTEIILEANLSQLAFRYNSLSHARAAAQQTTADLSRELTRTRRRERELRTISYNQLKGVTS